MEGFWDSLTWFREFIVNLFELIKYLFETNLLLGIFAAVVCIGLIGYVLFFLLLYFIYWAFMTEHYVLGTLGVVFILASYLKKEREARKPQEQEECKGKEETADFADSQEQHEDDEKKENRREDEKFDVNDLKECYRVLDCKETDSIKVIKAAYKECAKQYHPDFFSNKPKEFAELANKRMQEINLAYQRICQSRGSEN